MAPLRVLHSLHSHGVLTQNWLHPQINNPHIQSSILATERRRGDTRASSAEAEIVLEDVGRIFALLDRVLGKSPLRRSPFHLAAVETLQPDLVHFHFGDRAAKAWQTCVDVGVPFAVSFYGYDATLLVRRDPRWAERYREMFAEGGAAAFVEGPAMAERLCAMGARPEQVHIVHIGVDLSQRPFAPRHRADRQPLRLLLSGTFKEKKGIPVGVEAVGRFAQRHPGALDKLVIVGDAAGSDDSRQEKGRILAAIDRWLDADKVDLTGYVSLERLGEIAAGCDVALFPSVDASDGDSEGGFPVTATELGAKGLAIVCSDHADLPELIGQEETGLIVPQRDAAAMAEAIETVWEDAAADLARRRRMRARVEGAFSVEGMQAQLAALYTEVVGRRA